MNTKFIKDIQYYKFSLYGFFKNLKFFEPFFLLFLLEKGLSFWQIGLLYSIREITKNIFEIPSGIFADALGRRKTLIMSFFFYIFSFLGFFFADAYYLLVISIVFFAFGDAFRTGTNKAMIYDYITQKGWSNQKVHYYGSTRSWSQKGSALSSLIAASIVIAFQNYTVIFLASVIPYLINAAIIISYPKYLDGKTKVINSEKLINRFKSTFKNIWIVLRNPSYWRIMNLHAIHSGYYKAIKEYIQPIIVLAVLGLPFLYSWSTDRKEAIFIGLIYFVIYLFASRASKKAGKFGDRFKTKENALWFTLILGLVAGIITGVSVYLKLEWLAILFFMSIHFNENLRKPIGIAAVAEKSDKKVMASILSINSQAESLYAAIIAPFLGLLVDKTSLGSSIITVSSILIIISVVINVISRVIHR